MAFIELIIVIAMLITFSNVLSKVLPAIPIFFIQIILGVLLGITALGQRIHFEPEMFLVMIIGPLLFREGERADLPAILKNASTILFLAFGGVILTLVAVGYTLHWMLPALPLAGCFAFGAALAPTDAVAVSALARRLKIPKNVMHILEGEGLLNDASGVTALQFAIIALTTGSFSFITAGFTLLFSSVVGGLIGVLLVIVKQKLLRFIEQISAQDVTVYLLIELLLPFIAYFLAEIFHTSGIIAAVVAGVAQAQRRKRVNLFDAHLSNVSESTWKTIVFTLNALVFLFLGIELSHVFSPIWKSNVYSNRHLMLTVFIVTIALFVIRFLFLLAYHHIFQKNKGTKLQEVLLLTFGGVKGTVSLAAIFILPITINGVEFEARDLLLFLTACVILLSLIIGVIVLPLFADGESSSSVDFNQLLILAEVIRLLEEDERAATSDQEKWVIQAVISAYDNQQWHLYRSSMTDSEKTETQEIQSLILSIEQDGLDEAYRNGEISENGYRLYSRYLAKQQVSLSEQIRSFLSFWLLIVRSVIRILLHPKMFWKRRKQVKEKLARHDIRSVQKIYLQNSQYIYHSLENLEDIYDSELINFFIRERENQSKRFEQHNFVETMLAEQDPLFNKVRLRGYYLERKIIDEFEMSDKITTFSANEYRRNVNLLESYAMSQLSTSSVFRLFRK